MRLHFVVGIEDDVSWWFIEVIDIMIMIIRRYHLFEDWYWFSIVRICFIFVFCESKKKEEEIINHYIICNVYWSWWSYEKKMNCDWFILLSDMFEYRSKWICCCCCSWWNDIVSWYVFSSMCFFFGKTNWVVIVVWSLVSIYLCEFLLFEWSLFDCIFVMKRFVFLNRNKLNDDDIKTMEVWSISRRRENIRWNR